VKKKVWIQSMDLSVMGKGIRGYTCMHACTAKWCIAFVIWIATYWHVFMQGSKSIF